MEYSVYILIYLISSITKIPTQKIRRSVRHFRAIICQCSPKRSIRWVYIVTRKYTPAGLCVDLVRLVEDIRGNSPKLLGTFSGSRLLGSHQRFGCLNCRRNPSLSHKLCKCSGIIAQLVPLLRPPRTHASVP